MVALIVIGTCVSLQLAHVDDPYRVSHVTGAWFALAQYVRGVEAHDAVQTLRTLRDGHSGTPLKGLVNAQDQVLAEDPYVSVAYHRDPVVLDPFMLLHIERKHPLWQAALVRRIERQQFTKVVLLQRLDPSDGWWRYGHLGFPVVSAIARNYRFAGVAPRYYRPSEGAALSHYWAYVPKRSRNST